MTLRKRCYLWLLCLIWLLRAASAGTPGDCYSDLKAADTNKDGLLSPTEFVVAMDLISEGYFKNIFLIRFDSLPPNLQSVYYELTCQCPGGGNGCCDSEYIDISSLGFKVQETCLLIEMALKHAGVPGASQGDTMGRQSEGPIPIEIPSAFVISNEAGLVATDFVDGVASFENLTFAYDVLSEQVVDFIVAQNGSADVQYILESGTLDEIYDTECPQPAEGVQCQSVFATMTIILNGTAGGREAEVTVTYTETLQAIINDGFLQDALDIVTRNSTNVFVENGVVPVRPNPIPPATNVTNTTKNTTNTANTTGTLNTTNATNVRPSELPLGTTLMSINSFFAMSTDIEPGDTPAIEKLQDALLGAYLTVSEDAVGSVTSLYIPSFNGTVNGVALLTLESTECVAESTFGTCFLVSAKFNVSWTGELIQEQFFKEEVKSFVATGIRQPSFVRSLDLQSAKIAIDGVGNPPTVAPSIPPTVATAFIVGEPEASVSSFFFLSTNSTFKSAGQLSSAWTTVYSTMAKAVVSSLNLTAPAFGVTMIANTAALDLTPISCFRSSVYNTTCFAVEARFNISWIPNATEESIVSSILVAAINDLIEKADEDFGQEANISVSIRNVTGSEPQRREIWFAFTASTEAKSGAQEFKIKQLAQVLSSLTFESYDGGDTVVFVKESGSIDEIVPIDATIIGEPSVTSAPATEAPASPVSAPVVDMSGAPVTTGPVAPVTSLSSVAPIDQLGSSAPVSKAPIPAVAPTTPASAPVVDMSGSPVTIRPVAPVSSLNSVAPIYPPGSSAPVSEAPIPGVAPTTPVSAPVGDVSGAPLTTGPVAPVSSLSSMAPIDPLGSTAPISKAPVSPPAITTTVSAPVVDMSGSPVTMRPVAPVSSLSSVAPIYPPGSNAPVSEAPIPGVAPTTPVSAPVVDMSGAPVTTEPVAPVSSLSSMAPIDPLGSTAPISKAPVSPPAITTTVSAPVVDMSGSPVTMRPVAPVSSLSSVAPVYPPGSSAPVSQAPIPGVSPTTAPVVDMGSPVTTEPVAPVSSLSSVVPIGPSGSTSPISKAPVYPTAPTTPVSALIDDSTDAPVTMAPIAPIAPDLRGRTSNVFTRTLQSKEPSKFIIFGSFDVFIGPDNDPRQVQASFSNAFQALIANGGLQSGVDTVLLPAPLTIFVDDDLVLFPPTSAPSVSDAIEVKIEAAFIVSTNDRLGSDEFEAETENLALAFSLMTESIVNGTDTEVNLIPGSSNVTRIVEAPCPPENVESEVCYIVLGTFSISLADRDTSEEITQRQFGSAAEEAIDNGSLQQRLTDVNNRSKLLILQGLQPSEISFAPSKSPAMPTAVPSIAPTFAPTAAPTISPSFSPTNLASTMPSSQPSWIPSNFPSKIPSSRPSGSSSPSFIPSGKPSGSMFPSLMPSDTPSTTITPSSQPSTAKSASSLNLEKGVGGLSKGATAGIVLAALLILIGCIIFGYFAWKYRDDYKEKFSFSQKKDVPGDKYNDDSTNDDRIEFFDDGSKDTDDDFDQGSVNRLKDVEKGKQLHTTRQSATISEGPEKKGFMGLLAVSNFLKKRDKKDELASSGADSHHSGKNFDKSDAMSSSKRGSFSFFPGSNRGSKRDELDGTGTDGESDHDYEASDPNLAPLPSRNETRQRLLANEISESGSESEDEPDESESKPASFGAVRRSAGEVAKNTSTHSKRSDNDQSDSDSYSESSRSYYSGTSGSSGSYSSRGSKSYSSRSSRSGKKRK